MYLYSYKKKTKQKKKKTMFWISFQIRFNLLVGTEYFDTSLVLVYFDMLFWVIAIYFIL